MPGMVRKTDICSGHGCFPPRSNATSSPNVYANSIPVARMGDMRYPHCCPKMGCHPGSDCGGHNVYTNSRSNQTCGDGVS